MGPEPADRTLRPNQAPLVHPGSGLGQPRSRPASDFGHSKVGRGQGHQLQPQKVFLLRLWLVVHNQLVVLCQSHHGRLTVFPEVSLTV